MKTLEEFVLVLVMIIPVVLYYIIPTYLSKQQILDSHPRAIQQVNFTANLDRAGDTRIYFILEEGKETIPNFTQGTVKVL